MDAAVTTQNADLLIGRGIDVMLEYSVISAVAPTIMEKFNAAKIPVIAFDIPHPGAYFLGGDNYKSGLVTGQKMGEKAKAVWDGQVDLYISVEAPIAGETNTLRMGGTLDGIRQIIDLPESKIVRVDGKLTILDAQKVVTDTLTAHPDAKHILIGCIQDLNAQGALTAAEAAGRKDQVFIGSFGPFQNALEYFRNSDNKNGIWLGTTDFCPAQYGPVAMELVKKILAGESIPAETYFEPVWLNCDNMNTLYPVGGVLG